MKRIFHRVVNMISCNFGKGVILFESKDFNEISSKLLADYHSELFRFKSYVLSDTLLMEEKRCTQLEKILRAKISDALQKGEILCDYHFKGAKARMYLEDFLEGYRYCYRFITYDCGYIHDRSDGLINISLRKDQSIWKKLARQYGDVHSEIKILMSHISELRGNALDFKLTADRHVYHFSSNGVHLIDCPS